jgi:hypothetical protein
MRETPFDLIASRSPDALPSPVAGVSSYQYKAPVAEQAIVVTAQPVPRPCRCGSVSSATLVQQVHAYREMEAHEFFVGMKVKIIGGPFRAIVCECVDNEQNAHG